MQLVTTGWNRIVLLIPELGVAVKFPRINVVSAVKYFWRWVHRIHRYPAKKALRFFFTAEYDRRHSLRYYLCRGVIDNWNEYQFYRRTRNAFLWPTWFSFFGFMNVQPLAQIVTEDQGIYEIVSEVLGPDFTDLHSFDGHNLCSNNGEVYILDYASRSAQGSIEKSGKEIQGALRGRV